MIDIHHPYWRFAERWNGRLAMVGVDQFTINQMPFIVFGCLLAATAYSNVFSVVFQ